MIRRGHGDDARVAGDWPAMTDRPSGTITVLFTDIESSTKRWEQRPDEMRQSLARHDLILREVADEHRGFVFKHTGDGIAAAFAAAGPAIGAAIMMQQRLQNEDWSGADRLRVRMGLHTGDATLRDGDYKGPTVNRAARVMDVANGDQILVSAATTELVRGVEVLPQGEHPLKGIGTERIGLVSAPGLIVDRRPLRTRTITPTTTLPTLLPELIGRARELGQLDELIREHRLVTMVGFGGVGKTRLAIEAASNAGDRFPAGIVFCELASVNEEAVDDAVAHAIGARRQPGMSLVESIANYLEDREVLVVIDNCEHVLDASREIVRRLLTSGAGCVLATSREPLQLPGEQVVEVPPLDPSTAAVELFITRATERDANYSVGRDERRVIARICESLDGIPLAVELAAARARMLTPTELLSRLEDRFTVLRDTDHGRHRTLRDTVQWSYELLNEPEARLFDRLSVFSAGFALDAVEEVCPDDELVLADEILHLATALVDKSMLRREPASGRMRFRMLETLRQFAADALAGSGREDLFRERHAAFFAELVGQQADLLLSVKEPEVWEQLGREWGNVRAAFEASLERGNIDQAVDVALDVSWFATFSMRFEAFAFSERLLEDDAVADHPRLGALLGAGALGAYFTVDVRAAELAARGLEIDPSDPTGLCRAALSAVYLNNVLSPADSDVLTREWLDHAPEAPVPSRLWAEGMRAFHLGSSGNDQAAEVHATRVRGIADLTGSTSAAALACWAEGIALVRSDPEAAEATWIEGLDRARSLSSSHLMTHLITGLLLHMRAGRGDLASTIGLCRDTLEEAIDQHYLAGTSHLFGVAGICLARAGRAEAGGELLATMIANGHQPRSNARRSLTAALGHDIESYQPRRAAMTIGEAGQFALAELDAAAEGLMAEPHRSEPPQ